MKKLLTFLVLTYNVDRPHGSEVSVMLVVEPSLRRGHKKLRKSEINVFERLETVDCVDWNEDEFKVRWPIFCWL